MTETASTSHRHGDADSQIAVAIPHVGMVQTALAARGVDAEVRDESPELGLALLVPPVGQVEQAVAGDRPDDGSAALGHLMRLLYRDFERQYGGWVPTMGRNRTVRPVAAAHTIEGGGAGVPTITDTTLRPRNAEPGRGVRVGIADTALYAHPWLAGGYDAAPSSMWEQDPGQAPRYSAGHATFVAGLVLQRAPGAIVEARRVLGENAEAQSWDVAKQLVCFARSGLDVLNLSFGCFTRDNRPPLVLSTALRRLGSRVVVIAAAGNHGATRDRARPMWPAAMEDVVAVSATDGAGNRPEWSPDPILPWIDVAAPGEDVLSTYLAGKADLSSGRNTADGTFNGFATWSGTSFSAAQISGAVAAATVPGEIGAKAALGRLLSTSSRPSGSPVPWVR